MKILCVHGWLRSNIGDQLMAHIVLQMLREERHDIVVESHGFPSDASFDNYDTISRGPEQWTKEERFRHFSKFDRIVNLPGGGLQSADYRMPHIERDIKIASKLNIPYALSGHSICPLVDITILKLVTLIVAREPMTAKWLNEIGVPCVSAADYVWMTSVETTKKQNISLLMLRWDGAIQGESIKIEKDFLSISNHIYQLRGSLVVSTSDPLRDSELGKRLAEQLRCEWKPCTDVGDILAQIGGANLLITDRYHPAILARIAEVNCHFIGSPGVRNDGLRAFSGASVGELRRLAERGLQALKLWCRA